MKIGIMSMQRIKNYGSFLQAYGLKKTIENLGHEVVFVDYEIEKPIVKPPKESLMFKVRRKLNIVIKEKIVKRKNINNLYEEKYLKLLKITNKKIYRENVDILVIGSDEVFNCLQYGKTVGYSRELFGKDNNAKKVISYAGSFGHTTLNGLEKYGIDKEVSSLFKKFSNISVRDNNSYEIVKTLVENEVEVNLNVDPVIISNFESEIKIKNDIQNYILIYAYKNRINNEEEIKAIKKFAKKENKKLVSIGAHQNWVDIQLEADPFELLGYVKTADYIITDTFHGTIFSLKYNRPFVTIVRENNKQKLRDLLNKFDVKDREINDFNKLNEIILKSIEFNKINEKIKIETDKSIKYLKENIQLSGEFND